MGLNLGKVQPQTQAAAELINQRFPGHTIGGWRATGSVANSDHPKGLAIDIMTNNGDPIAAWIIANATNLNINYLIWNRRIWQNGNWQPYNGPSPHTDHVHVSFNAGGNVSNVTSDGTSSGLSGCNPLALMFMLPGAFVTSSLYNMLCWRVVKYATIIAGIFYLGA